MHICIVVPSAYPALAGDLSTHIGHMERQATLLACWLAAQGHRVSLVTWDEGQPTDCVISGVRVIKLCQPNAGLPGVRFLYPRWTSLTTALRVANADVYYLHGGASHTGQVALWCRWRGRKVVCSIDKLSECDITLPRMRLRSERMWHRLGLRLADEIIVQTRAQYQLLQEGFARDSRVIPPANVELRDTTFVDRDFPPAEKQRILWVGRLCQEKHPDRLVELADKCADLQFDLVGLDTGSTYARQLLAAARQRPNITVHGRVAPRQLAELYHQAACLCCTFEDEGYFNVLLEAWGSGLPIVSTVDPDNDIVRNGLGSVVENVDAMAVAVRQLLASPEQWRAISRRVRYHCLQNHHAEWILPQFEQAFFQVLRGARSMGMEIAA